MQFGYKAFFVKKTSIKRRKANIIQREKEPLEIFQWKIIRTIMGHKKETSDELKPLMNQEIDKLSKKIYGQNH